MLTKVLVLLNSNQIVPVQLQIKFYHLNLDYPPLQSHTGICPNFTVDGF